MPNLRDELLAEIDRIPIIDVHSHLNRDKIPADDLKKVIFYHMVCYPLRAAGVPEEKIWPQGKGFHGAGPDWEVIFENWDQVTATGFGWALRTMLSELYDFHEPLEAGTLPRLQKAFDDRAGQGDWGEEILARAGVKRVLSSRIEVEPLAEARPDPGIRFTVESTPTVGNREHYSWAQRLAWLEKKGFGRVTSVDDLRQLAADFYERYDWSDKHALVTWISSEADFRPVPDETVNSLLSHVAAGAELSPDEIRLQEGALIRAVCEAIRGKTGIFQICFGVQFVTPGRPHPVARRGPQFTSSLGNLFGEFPEIHFNLLTGYEADEPLLCAHCLAYPNVSLAGYWWHTFYPTVMHDAWHRRLDMVPPAGLCGFFSDGWCAEWTYARVQMTRRVLANVLAEKVDRGFYDRSQAVEVARKLLFETPRRIFLPHEDIQPL